METVVEVKTVQAQYEHEQKLLQRRRSDMEMARDWCVAAASEVSEVLHASVSQSTSIEANVQGRKEKARHARVNVVRGTRK